MAAEPRHDEALDALHAQVAKSGAQAGWSRLLILLDEDAKRSRWSLGQEDRP
jgi:hypothetical protein